LIQCSNQDSTKNDSDKLDKDRAYLEVPGTVRRVNAQKLNVREFSALIGESTQAVYDLINEGVIPAYRPSPRRTYLLADEALAAYHVRVVPRPKRTAAPPVKAVLAEPVAQEQRRTSGKQPQQNLRARALAHSAYAHLKRAS
jgi:hypothetical protein